MSLDQRSSYLLHSLINHEAPLSLKELTGTLRVSRRTIYYDVEKINQWLVTHKLEEIQVEPTKGFYLTNQTKKQIPKKLTITNDYSYKYSESERQTMIFLIILLSPTPVHLKDLTEWSRVSRNSCLSDLKKVTQTCHSFRLTLLSSRKNGYTISGSEYQIRRLFLELFKSKASSFASHSMQEIFLFYDARFFTIVELVEKLLLEINSNLEVELRTETIHQLSWQLAFFCHRVRLNHLIQLTEDEIRTIRDIPVYPLISDLFSTISKESSIRFPNVEVCYFTIFLLSNRFQMVDQLHHFSEMKKSGQGNGI